jgi:hypothetical protein
MIPYVAADAAFVNRVTYTPEVCGTRQIYVVAKAAGVEATQSLALANAPCRVIFPFFEKQ